jgi:NAD(P)-dependent dehydrogenase (short-subunit alcohol dehydrogenase family)
VTIAARRVLVTGAASGIGRGTVELLLERGHDVVGLDRDGTVIHVLRELGGTSAVIADVTDPEMVERAVREAAGAMGGLDGVVNAAGIGGYTGDVAETTPEAWRTVISVDLDGVFHVCRAAVPRLREAGGGVIVNVSS